MTGWYKQRFLVGMSISRMAKSTSPMGEVDHGTFSPFAFLSSDDLALSVVNLTHSAHLTFLDLLNTELLSFLRG